MIRRLLDVGSLIDERSQEHGESAIVLFARGSDIDRLASAQGSYTGRFHITLTRHVIEGIVQFEPGATYQDGPYRFSITAIQLQPGHLWLLTQQSDAVSAFARRPRARRSMYLRNQRTSEAILGSSWDLRTDVTLMRFLPFAIGVGGGEGEESGFSARAVALEFPPTYAHKDLPFRSTRNGSVRRSW